MVVGGQFAAPGGARGGGFFVSHLKCLVAKRRLVVDLVAALQWSMESATVHCGCWIRKGEEGKVEEMISFSNGVVPHVPTWLARSE